VAAELPLAFTRLAASPPKLLSSSCPTYNIINIQHDSMQLIFIAYRVIINYCLVHTVLDIYKKETSEYRRRKTIQKWLIFFFFPFE
jgi:uncharacterized membrane protein YkvI